jgi:hypothetical protein
MLAVTRFIKDAAGGSAIMFVGFVMMRNEMNRKWTEASRSD